MFENKMKTIPNESKVVSRIYFIYYKVDKITINEIKPYKFYNACV